jgi:hypothetical protein
MDFGDYSPKESTVPLSLIKISSEKIKIKEYLNG